MAERPFIETRTGEQIERDAMAAAERQHAADVALFMAGKYPGWCEGAADGTCTHPVKHRL